MQVKFDSSTITCCAKLRFGLMCNGASPANVEFVIRTSFSRFLNIIPPPTSDLFVLLTVMLSIFIINGASSIITAAPATLAEALNVAYCIFKIEPLSNNHSSFSQNSIGWLALPSTLNVPLIVYELAVLSNPDMLVSGCVMLRVSPAVKEIAPLLDIFPVMFNVTPPPSVIIASELLKCNHFKFTIEPEPPESKSIDPAAALFSCGWCIAFAPRIVTGLTLLPEKCIVPVITAPVKPPLLLPNVKYNCLSVASRSKVEPAATPRTPSTVVFCSNVTLATWFVIFKLKNVVSFVPVID